MTDTMYLPFNTTCSIVVPCLTGGGASHGLTETRSAESAPITSGRLQGDHWKAIRAANESGAIMRCFQLAFCDQKENLISMDDQI